MSQGAIRSEFTHNVARSVIDAEEFREHAQSASTAQLLLVAVHVTADPTLLDRYENRVGRPAALPLGGVVPAPVPAEAGVREELLQLLEETLTSHEQPEYLAVPSREDFSRMSTVAVGKPIKQTQIDMNLEQAGFVPDARSIEPTKNPPKTLNLAIIGAGMTGIDAAVKATDRGFEWEIFAMDSGIGGLWWSQTYPGVAVDTPCVYYSLSWEVTPDWSRHYPLGAEYSAYLQNIAKKYELEKHINFNSEITRMEWLEADQVWELTVFSTVDHTSRKVRAAAVLTAAGHLNRPNYPQVIGREDFAGESIHTAEWRDVSLEGKRVGVVGVGAAGVQVISAIAPKVGDLTVFQRQPVWLSQNTMGDGAVSDSERWLRRHLPYYLHWARLSLFAGVNSISHLMNEVDLTWMSEHDTSISEINEMVRQACLRYIDEAFGEDSELAKKVTPDFPYGGKRPVRDPGDDRPGGYYWALKQPHVQLETSGLARVVPEGILTADGVVHELDVIIWATGMTLDFLAPVEIVGLDGVTLREAWEDYLHPRAYLGGMVPGFPNLFVNDGPHTGVANGGAGHNFMAETVNHFIFEALQLAVENQATSIEVTQQAYDAHTAELEEKMSHLIWMHDDKANTYYRNPAGYVILPSPFLPEDYWTRSRKPDPSAFVLREASDAEAAA
ncbi:flavin-containing monooxygenase [Subtercola endophyticus]|uniref:flavin-containing monooxygenase n=1 Tax=Subtercola endophyticus TaxID=2895559 RepID=UPI001E5B74AD|nr:NAD(P)/FAD-dependent oxidoreductase [Subtercola endophyticus]UFS58740.1 NAD(P)/FAD-dependent oxidoreductase [Subtercola endophyticus]